ncbi:MAG TPA: DUF885 domain-containing protein [Acidimicrobiales bacterium]|jgi:uncharacterized protein (DUF885 family)|nr:DUF885 domain-containing protein [Acidimicrobiales bacterium]
MSADDLASELLKTVLDADPLAGSLYGFPGYDDRLPDLSAESEQRVDADLTSIAQRAEDLPDVGLNEPEHQTLDFARVMARGMAGAAEVPLTEFTICDTFVAPVPGVLTTLPKLQLDTEERRQGYLARLRALPELLATAGERHRQGTSAGRTAVARLVESAVAQLDLLIADPGLGGVARTEQADDGFRRAAGEAIDQGVRPALAAYRDGLRADILPAARDDDHPGICFLPDGDAMYRAMARLHTSTDYTPDELHAMGREIVAQVREELIETGSRLWHTSEPTEIFDHLCNDPELRYASRDEMLEHARRVVAAAEREAPRWFATVPDQPCTVEPVPEAEEAGMAAAYYMPGAIDGSRHGTYYLNTYKPEERHRYAAEDIAFHEAVPGHHFQLTIAMESTDLSSARRVLHDTACAEGWGLYSERLADEMGLYSDDVARMGLFAADSWRASRLVVDTGIHALGWSRRKAVEWLGANTPMPRIEVESEVDRYISFPGQALAYMVGRREIVRLRARAAEGLGARFDLKQFHDLVLRVGILPLPALARTVERWIERSATA